MTKLSDAQLVILSAAAQREDRNVLPLPSSLREGAAAKMVSALFSRALIAETTTDSQVTADAVLNRIWRNAEDGRAILLHITNAGLAAIGIERRTPIAPTPAPLKRRARMPNMAKQLSDTADLGTIEISSAEKTLGERMVTISRCRSLMPNRSLSGR